MFTFREPGVVAPGEEFVLFVEVNRSDNCYLYAGSYKVYDTTCIPVSEWLALPFSSKQKWYVCDVHLLTCTVASIQLAEILTIPQGETHP